MRRAQSVKNYARPSLALASDDLGVLREGDETNEDVLRRLLLEKDRENDRVCSFWRSLMEDSINLIYAVTNSGSTPPSSTCSATAGRTSSGTREGI